MRLAQFYPSVHGAKEQGRGCCVSGAGVQKASKSSQSLRLNTQSTRDLWGPAASPEKRAHTQDISLTPNLSLALLPCPPEATLSLDWDQDLRFHRGLGPMHMGALQGPQQGSGSHLLMTWTCWWQCSPGCPRMPWFPHRSLPLLPTSLQRERAWTPQVGLCWCRCSNEAYRSLSLFPAG